jgi:hypothetical protein
MGRNRLCRGILRARPVGFERALRPRHRSRSPALKSRRPSVQGGGRDRPTGRARPPWSLTDGLAPRLKASARPQALLPSAGNPAARGDYSRFRWPSPNPPTRSLRSDSANSMNLIANVSQRGHAVDRFSWFQRSIDPCRSTARCSRSLGST